MATIDEIRTKYQCDKRQTGQLGIRYFGSLKGKPINYKKEEQKHPGSDFLKEYKHENRQSNKPNDPLSNGKAKSTREAKAAFLGVLRNFENTLKKSDDKRAIQMAYANMTTKFQDFLKQI